jgi:prepilin-type N-terminal cleavage/methylation domain-containing protein
MKQVRGWQGKNVSAAQAGAGFTLIEILFTIMIALILTAMAIPLLQSVLTGYRLNGAVSSMTGAIQSTRYQAIFNGYPFQLVIDKAAMTYQVKSDPTRGGAFTNYCVPAAASCPVPLAGSGTQVAIGANTTITFSPGGSVGSTTAAGGMTQIVVTYKTKQETINVSSYGNTKVTTP